VTSVLMATTDGLTRATKSAIEGNAEVCPSVGGGVQPGSMGVAVRVVGGEVVGGAVTMGGSGQPLVTRRNITMTRLASRYLRFIFFMANFILARGRGLGKGFLALSVCFAKLVKSATLQVNSYSPVFAFSDSVIV